MKALSMYVWSFLVIMVVGLTSCGNDEDVIQLSEEELAYINKNREYIWEKKAEKDESGELRYQQVVMAGDTALYRIVQKENDWKTVPTATSLVYLNDLEGTYIDGRVFQKKIDSSFQLSGIIPGLRGVLMNVHLDETVEAIIPATLGYGYHNNGPVPMGSTLIFTFTLDKVVN